MKEKDKLVASQTICIPRNVLVLEKTIFKKRNVKNPLVKAKKMKVVYKKKRQPKKTVR